MPQKVIKISKKLVYMLALSPLTALAWNIPGHKVIAEIAYQNLNPKAKATVYCLLKHFQRAEPRVKTFQQLAAWPDVLRQQGITAFNSWHFVDQPIYVHTSSEDGDRAFGKASHFWQKPNEENAVWAVQQAKTVLQDSNADTFNKAWSLAFLSHVEGDIHQPLHASTRISREYPEGDHGGNFFLIKSQKYKNLHQLWDSALGALPSGATHKSSILKLANEWQREYPKKMFGKKIEDVNPQDWANESFNIAKNFVYSMPENSKPSAAYMKQGRIIAKKQIVLAGYRLSVLLNQQLLNVVCAVKAK